MTRLIIKILSLILLVIISFYLGYRYGLLVNFSKTPVKPPLIIYKNLSIPTSIPYKELDTSNWKSYLNSELGFSLKYPENYYLRAFKQDPGLGDAYIVDIRSNKSIEIYGTKNNELQFYIFINDKTIEDRLDKYGYSDSSHNIPYETQYYLTRQSIGNESSIRWRTTGPSNTGSWLKSSNPKRPENNRFIENESAYEKIIFFHKNLKFTIIKAPADTLIQNEFEEIISSFELF